MLTVRCWKYRKTLSQYQKRKNDVKAAHDLMFVKIYIITSMIPLNLSSANEAA